MKVNQLTRIIKNSIDIHVHIGPEIIPRKYTVGELIQKEEGNIAGCVLKNHFYPTSPLINSVRQKTNLQLFGSIVLNNFVGGLNPEAIYAVSLLSSKTIFVWFPTINARQFLKYSKYEIAPEWIGELSKKNRIANYVQGLEIMNKNNNISKQTLEVLRMIKETNSVLATGHISWEESELLALQALRSGINKIVITHPIYQKINMPVEVQKKLAIKGCFIEQCFSMYSIDKISIKKIASQIKTIGSDQVILSSDVGQSFSYSPSKALYMFSKLLIREGITLNQLEVMLVKNPKTLLGIKQ